METYTFSTCYLAESLIECMIIILVKSELIIISKIISKVGVVQVKIT